LSQTLVISQNNYLRNEDRFHPYHYYHPLRGPETARFEEVAELYYLQQKKERKEIKARTSDVDHVTMIGAEFPCIWGTYPVGGTNPDNIIDGHKFACALHFIHPNPIVYSFGSNNDPSFELALLKIRPDCEVHIFELDKNRIPKNIAHPNINFHAIGIGYKEDIESNKNPNFHFLSLDQIMKMLNHTHIDILKMDVEGAEWGFVVNEWSILKRVGQYLVELHTDANPQILAIQQFKPNRFGNVSVFDWFDMIEKSGLRMFHKEWNFISKCCMEYSFVQRKFQEYNNYYGGARSQYEN
jgi:hypothetical protein